ncbi:unnamed protein product [Rotaria sp. Silwood2]|nr:unnamed protein product [Rotaria sp. Silwood2]CAF3093818.1 unnamed protein product [Rotaria sp. Silwood2]CAF4130009.1 unnamed protein product [Rotaria sp. Silwood2]
MMMSWLTIFTGFAVLSSLIIADDPCRYQDTKKGVLDLTSVGRTDGKAAYADKIPPTVFNYKYSYNPCKPFTEEPACKGVAVCQVSMDGKFSFSLGTQDSVIWNPGTGLGSSPTISYSAGPKQVTVTLQCATDGTNELEALGEPTTNNYKFILTHKCACWDGCGSGPSPDTTTKSSGGGGSSGGITGGAVFIIILCVLLVVYFVGFAVFYRFRLERAGVELIAHRTFWVGLPGYAKDGVVHIYRRVLNKGDTPYQSV